MTLGELTGSGNALPGGNPTSSADRFELAPGKFGVKTTTDFHQDKL